MIKIIKTCDKCHKEVVNPQEITISSMNYLSRTLQLCPDHYEIFLSIIEPIRKSAEHPSERLYDYLFDMIHEISTDVFIDRMNQE